MVNTDTEPEQSTVAESIARVHYVAMILMGTVATEMAERILEPPPLGGSDEPGQPASKVSIDAMPRIAVTEDRGKDCSICLDEIGVGVEIREMPCKHGLHSGCIEKWLGVHGSCPVCRYVMPVEGEDGGDDSNGSDDGQRQRRRRLIDTLIITHGRAGDRSTLSGSDGGSDSSYSTRR